MAMLLDGKLSSSAVFRVLEEKYRAVATSPGVDLAAVLKYALAARRWQRVRDGVLALLILGVFVIPYGILGLLILAFTVVAVEMYLTYKLVIFPLLSRDAFDPAAAPRPGSSRVEERIADIASRARGNVSVFANYLPFTGHGEVINKWSFALNVAKPEEGKQVIPFQVSELYDHVAAEVGKLGLPGVSVENKLFVNGLDLRHGPDPQVRQAVLPDPMAAPVPQVDESFIKALRDDPESHARPYLVISVMGWDGELVLSVFLRFALLPRRDLLFVEAGYSLLPPLRERYRKVDDLVNCSPLRQIGRIAQQAVLRTPVALLLSIPNTLNELGGPLRRRRKNKEDAKAISDRTFNYGSTWSPRESAADNRYHRYFQQLDKEMYVKTAEYRIMDAVAEFMTSHNIDVSDLVQRQTTILNNGIYVSGQAQVNAQSMAAGVGAMARAGNMMKQEIG
ncbi:hypothetical protein [Streptosporangium fragile]|uniref:hypothetical protein n=1 Tax=Streptosporangium fragile TaxID=46186 RepID=UPI0031E4FDE8